MQQARDGGLMPALEAAATELREDGLRLHSAIGNEKKARDQMREIARLLILSQDAAVAIKQAILELDRAIDGQKKVTADTEKTTKQDGKPALYQQAAVVDDTRPSSAKDIVASRRSRRAPEGATDEMPRRARKPGKSDEPKKRIESRARQQEALTQMKEARHALEEQLAKLNSAKPRALSPLSELREESRRKRKEGLRRRNGRHDDMKHFLAAPSKAS
jgi:hypothetical protein